MKKILLAILTLTSTVSFSKDIFQLICVSDNKKTQLVQTAWNANNRVHNIRIELKVWSANTGEYELKDKFEDPIGRQGFDYSNTSQCTGSNCFSYSYTSWAGDFVYLRLSVVDGKYTAIYKPRTHNELAFKKCFRF